MNIVVCTLFEGHYHYGVAALVNSLSKNGFTGHIYAGYKGSIPEWANGKKGRVLHWDNASTITPADGIDVHFIPVKTDFHLTNYKPGFVIELMEQVSSDVSGVFYFDPDIVIKCRWSFYELWLTLGVPLVHEITNNDMPATHPVRILWRDLILKNDLEVTNHIHSYINAGFWGISRENVEFAHLYKKFVDISVTDYNMDLNDFTFDLDRTNPFFAKDQDALNIAAMCSRVPLSEYGPEAMDFVHGGKVMSHATGSPKPWKKNYMLSFLKGNPPSLSDRAYWNNTNDAVRLYPGYYVGLKQLEMKIATFLGRFYKRY
ncbi:hypothetical protein [Dyadobacter sp. CY351]|uniref:hypothetical protein n=1 Tax=Dyadobacter sp. CY351 TaxID=2909337 RepID=UPI001F1AE717|nr:hypothetical protein [Dyadobacter sp. CY351]MCF2519162.1 hypothetical protein [Dyadobacter sp. CY351]